jgi:23S rRNA (cytosine1962-C5)-methyltransferase
VVAVDASPTALALAQQNIELNDFTAQGVQLIQDDVFQRLRTYRDSRRSFDVIILDPPKFAATAAHAERAARGYKDINLLALKLLREGGLLATFSCSGGIDAGLFQQIVASAAQDAGVDVQIVDRLHQAPDHPVNSSYPEGAYLKGLVVYKRPASG